MSDAADRSTGDSAMRPSIAIVLSLVFGVLVLVAGGTILFVGTRAGLSSAEALTVDKAVLILDSVTERLKAHLLPAWELTENLSGMVAAGELDPDDSAALSIALEASRSSTPQVRSVLYVSPALVVMGYHAEKPGEKLEVEDWSGIEGVLEEFDTLEEHGDSLWGNPVYVPDLGVTVLNVRTPVFRNDQYAGAFIAAVGVDELSRHLGAVKATAGEVPFVLSGSDLVIAHPSLQAQRWGRTADEPLLPLVHLNDAVLAHIWDEGAHRGAGRAPLPSGYQAISTRSRTPEGEQDYIMVFKQEYGFGETPWTVGVHFPADTIGEQIIRLLRVGIIGLALLAVGIVATVLIAAGIAKPLRRLSDAARQLDSVGPGGVEMLPPSRFKELHAASQAFNRMVLGMRERELIRDLFGRFVPREVAQSLVADRGNLTPQTREATVFFSDVIGFSTIAEGIPPEALIELLNEYFELLGGILNRYQGVVQQFQGDAILATFNLPVPDTEHAANAVRAALDIQNALEGRTFGRGLKLPTRIGINTGMMVGGTVGSENRKGYTVHGDHVNLAARIEQMNKQYDTRILVAESTARQAGAAFRFEPIGEVPVRGRHQSVRLYRVLSAG